MIVNKSLMHPWHTSAVFLAPQSAGVYVLRGTHKGMLYVGQSRNLRDRLLQHLSSGDIPGVRYFHWFQTLGVEYAKVLERVWILRHSPPYNRRAG